MSESIHAQRGKRWGRTAYAAEWLENSMKYCRDDPKGKRDFEAWVMEKYGPDEGCRQLRLCQGPPPNYSVTRVASPWDARGLLARPAVDLGASLDALVLYEHYTTRHSVAFPERTKPAPKRRRGESSIDWLSRRQEALLDGSKFPDMDWGTARAIAVSELDRTQDTIRVWRTNPEVFFQDIVRRSESYIPSDEFLQLSHERLKLIKMRDAFRALQRGILLSHMTWQYALELFDDFARRGLTTSSSIERAYKSDSKLFWRVVSLFTKVNVLHNYHLTKLCDELSWSEHFRPFFTRSRGLDGLAVATPTEKSKSLTGIEDMVVRAVCEIHPHVVGFFSAICRTFRNDPSEAKKFSEAAFDVLGDVAIVHEFHSAMLSSPFGNRLRAIAMTVTSSNCHAHPDFFPELTFMDPIKYVAQPDHPGVNVWGYSRSVTDSIGITLAKMVTNISLYPLGESLGQVENVSPADFDRMWLIVDTELWQTASYLDRPGAYGTVAKHLGLLNPKDPGRLTYGKYLFERTRNRLAIEPALPPLTAPSEAAQSASWSYASGDARAMSAHAYLSENTEGGSKDKIKTRGSQNSDNAEFQPTVPRNLFEDEAEIMDFPDFLPTEFKLGKKNKKVFHRILDPRDDGEETGDRLDAARLGQVRWGDFEKAMKRIGFSVCQTAGSSVRFDPPAKTARPITFHRPHPDSTLGPLLLKRIGARLKRCYGWTIHTFIQGAEDT